MHWIDWLIVGAYLTWIVWTGIQHTKDSHEIEGYFLANRSLPWWAVGLSVMATQLSAITLIGTTGQAYADGMRFLQFYFALPIAMIVLSVTLVPFFHRAHVFTAYEYLERRFDAKTRAMTSLLFLLSRGMSTGVVISAPAVVLSVVFGWNFTLTCLAIGLPTALYTMYGGVQAVTWTDVKQMFLIVGGLVAAVIALILGLPDGVGLGDALHIAGATGRMRTFDFTFSFTDQYTFWSGTIAALFLFLSYFGTDQSQVQRYLTAKSIDEARSSLLMSAYWKIPLQALVLLVGVLLFAFHLFTPPPLLFNKVEEARVRSSASAGELQALEQRYESVRRERGETARALNAARQSGDDTAIAAETSRFRAAEAGMKTLRDEATTLVSRVTGQRYNDVNYVFPTFITTYMPIGVVGLLLAAIFAAAMSSIAAELNSLSTATVIDFYRRFARKEASDAHYLAVSKIATGFWGTFACIVAIYAAELGSLIEVVNRFGSFFYGSILGVFMLAILWKRASGHAAFVSLLVGMGTVGYVAFTTDVAFLWLNVVGALTVFTVGVLLSLVMPRQPARANPQ